MPKISYNTCYQEYGNLKTKIIMTTDIYIQENKIETFKKGDKVVMHTCHESTFYKDKVWTCQTDSFLARDKSEVVFLDNFSGYFSAKFLKKID